MTEQVSQPVTRTDTSTLTDDEIRAQVLAIVVDLAPNPDTGRYTETSRLIDDMGYHSLALMEITFALEDEFDLEPIDEDAARKIRTVRHVQDLVVERARRR